MQTADLHAHTTRSDGLLSPRELVQLASQTGLKAVAITDHDMVDGIEEARFEGKKLGIEVIPGVEISTAWDNVEIHMLGYFINTQDTTFLKRLENQRKVRQMRNQMIIEKLRELGIEITLEEVLSKQKELGGKGNVGRPHIAEVLIEKGVVQTMDEAFEQYLGKRGKAYISPIRISPQEAVQWIRQNGGVAVVAHPGLYRRDDLIQKLIQEGLMGIEVDHPDHTEEDKARYRKMAEKYQLVATAGSDFHGERHGSMYHAPLGTCRVPWERVLELKALARNS